MAGSLERDRRIYSGLVAAFAVLTVVFAAVAVAAINHDDNRPVRVIDRRSSAAAATVGESADTGPASVTGSADVGGGAIQNGPGQASSGAGPTVRQGTTAADTNAAGAVVQPGGDIVVGSVITQSGAISFTPSAQAVRAFFAQLNQDGGINGRKVRLILYDDGLDATRSRAAFKRLLEQDKVIAVVSSFAPLGEGTATPDLEKAGVGLIPASGLSLPPFNSPIGYFLTGTLENYGKVACKEALRKGQKRVALIYISTDLIQPIIGSYEQCVKNGGGAVLREEVPLGNPDYTASVLRIRQFNADLIFQEIAQADTVKLWQTMDRQGVQAASQLVPGSDQPIVRDYTGPAGRNVSIQTTAIPAHLDRPELARMKAAVARFSPGATVNSLAVDKWVGCLLFVEAARRAGDELSRATLLQQMAGVRDFNGKGLVNPISYAPGKRTGTDLFWFFDKVGTGFGPVGPPRGP